MATTASPALLTIEQYLRTSYSPDVDFVDDHAMGVQNIWLIDPMRRNAFTYGAKGLSDPIFDTLAAPNTAITLDLRQLFAALDGEDA